MNALASIRQLWSSASSVSPDSAARTTGSKISIPTAELRQLGSLGDLSSTAGVTSTDTSFSGLLGQMVRDVNAKQQVATQAMSDLQSGQNVSLHQAMISMEEASVSFQLMVEVRNRMLESYQELMRMQV